MTLFHLITLLLACYFLIGALTITITNKKKGGAKERWTKFTFYFLIVYGIIGSLHFIPACFPMIAGSLVVTGYAEIVKNNPKPFVWRPFLIVALMIYTCISALFILFSLKEDPATIAWLYMLVLTFDGFSQLSGQLFGKRKIAGQISPGKTLEGSAGGLIFILLTAFFLHDALLREHALSYYWITIPVISITAFAGDLLASAYKRKAGIKDYSHLIPGHGGVLDRFDSLMGAAAGYELLSALLKWL